MKLGTRKSVGWAIFAARGGGTESASGPGMRVTTDMNFRMLSEALQRQQFNIQDYQQKIASGKEVTKASDDPGAFGMIRNFKAEKSQLVQYSRNVNLALQYNESANQGMSKAIDLMHRINELTVEAGDGTMEETSMKALAEEVDAMLKSMISVANTSEGGRYTFAGLRTDTKPYETVLDPVDGRIVSVNYVGSEEIRTIKTGDTLEVPANYPGSTSTSEGGIFQTATKDVFDAIIQLRDALNSGVDVSTSDIPANLQSHLDHLLANTSLNGARKEQISMHKTLLLDLQTANREATDAFESADYAATMIKLTESENAYKAALTSASRMLQQVNLLDLM